MQVFRNFQKYVFITCLICLFLPATVYPMMLALSTEELKTQSDVILRGTVEDVTGHWGRDHMVIVTHVEVCVLNVYKGALDRNLVTSKEVIPGTFSQDFIIIEFMGGVVDDIEFGMSDMPRFKKEEEVILFLKIAPSQVKDDIYTLVGSSQGKYVIDDKGMVNKDGFAVLYEKEEDKEKIDNHIPFDELVEKIDENRTAFVHVNRKKTEVDNHEKV